MHEQNDFNKGTGSKTKKQKNSTAEKYNDWGEEFNRELHMKTHHAKERINNLEDIWNYLVRGAKRKKYKKSEESL